MKRFYASFAAILAAFALNAQVNVTLQVDMSDEVKTNPLKTVKVAGAFAAAGATSKGTAMADWTPPQSPVFTKVAGTANTWQIVITFPNASKGTEVFYKFMNTADSWGTCDVDQECFKADAVIGAGCTQAAGDFNRILKVPTAATVIGFKFNTCVKLGVNTRDLALDSDVSIAPNPANDFTVVKIADAKGLYNVSVATIAGQMVQIFENVADQAIIEGLSAGMYLVTVRDAEGKFNTQKLVVE